MARKRWHELEVRTQRLLLASALFEGTLKIAALIDLARRPSNQIRGSKWAWAPAIALINAVGAVPIVYFFWGRRTDG